MPGASALRRQKDRKRLCGKEPKSNLMAVDMICLIGLWEESPEIVEMAQD